MTPFIGLLEWVNNTKQLSSIIESEYGSSKSIDKIRTFDFHSMKKYREWLRSNYNDKYIDLYNKGSINDIENNYNECVKSIPNTLLKNYIKKLSIGAESYIINRNELMKDIGIINISSYLLGIGDRHLVLYI